MSVIKMFFPKKDTFLSPLKGHLEASKLFRSSLGVSSNINEVIGLVLNLFFYDKILQVQKSIKTQVQFFIKCRLKVDLVLYTYVFIYLKATVKKIYHDFYLGFNKVIFVHIILLLV